MTVKGGKKCHICLERRRYTCKCDYCGHNTCFGTGCLFPLVSTAVIDRVMCWKCQTDPSHRTLKEVPVGIR